MPTSSDRIVCIKEEGGQTDAIDIDLSGIDLDTSTDSSGGDASPGTAVYLYSTIDNTSVELDITGDTTGSTTTPSTIDTTGAWSNGIFARLHTAASAGTVTVTLSDTQITTSGSNAAGLYGGNSSDGDLTVNLNPGVTIGTTGDDAAGIRLSHSNDQAAQDNDIVLNARGITVTTQGGGNMAYPVWATRENGPGDVRLDIRDSTLSSTGHEAVGIYAVRAGNTNGNGDIDIDLVGGRITTGAGDSSTGTGGFAHGILAQHSKQLLDEPGIPAGNIEITTGNHAIETTATAYHPDVPGGTYAYGIYAVHNTNGNTVIDLGSGSSVTTQGENSHGIVAYHYGEGDTRSMDITVDGSVTVNGEAAQGVRVGALGASGPERMAGLDSEGYRRQKVTVNGSITSDGEGVFLANGGRVIIGPQGSIRSGSGIAILATGTVPADSTDPQNVIAAIPPKLRVDLNLDGRRVSEALGDDWILNDGGQTTLAVNNTVLHDGATGNTGNTARNGARDVTLASPGVKVTDRTTDPWTTAASTAAADRDFRALDFSEAEEVVQTCPPASKTDRIVCHEESASSSPIDIDVTGIDIDTTVDYEHGVHALHEGSGNTNIRITGTTATPSTIDTAGLSASGIQYHYEATASGTATLTLDNTEITTQDASAIVGLHSGSGVIKADLRTGVVIDTSGSNDSGVVLSQENEGGNHDVIIQAQGIQVTTRGSSARGLWARQYGSGEARIDVRDSTIVTEGNFGYGIYGYRPDSSGDIDIDVVGGSTTTGKTTTSGSLGFGIYAWHQNQNAGSEDDVETGNIEIHTRDHAIKTTATVHNPSFGGTFAYGIYADHENSGNSVIDLGAGSSITTEGKNSHGIVAYQRHVENPGSIDIAVNGAVTVNGAAAQGVRVGALSGTAPQRIAPLDNEGYRLQKVTVNEPITSTAEGVFLANGGRVIIGPQGSIRSGSGIAILATGTVPADGGDPAIPPKLRVDLNLDGRRVSEALGDDWILNDGGQTTIAVNSTVLHDGATGNTGNTARNGSRDVTLADPGVRVIDRTDPDPVNWTTEASTAPADRDFRAMDFSEAGEEPTCPPGQIGTPPNCRDPAPPAPPVPPEPPQPPVQPEPPGQPPSASMCPAGQVGTPPDCMTPQPEPGPGMPMLVEEYAPRAALYEALPEFLLGLQTGEPAGAYRVLPKPPTWIELRGSSGSQDFDRSTVGAKYDADHFVVEAGGTVLEREHWNVDASLHHLTGSAEVSSPVRGGDIHVKGAGLSLAAHWHNEDSYYATGRVSWTNYYDLAISSDTVGRLVSELDAERLALHVEAGRRMHWGEDRVWWTPHVRLGHTRVSVDSFTDTVQARASFPDADRYAAGLGLMVETVKDRFGGELALMASLDIEHKFGSTDTSSRVSGERLSAEPQENSASLALGSAWRQGPWMIDAVISAREGSDDDEYSGSLNLGMRF